MSYLSPVGNDQQADANGNPLVGGKIYTYLAGSTTPAATYTDSGGLTNQANPVILNSLGLPASPIWLTGGVSYKLVIKDSADVTQRTIDNISGINDIGTNVQEWSDSGFVPTYISGTSFSVIGDQTTTLQVNRRVRTRNTSGYVYGRITASVYASTITTVTVLNDSGVLDSGLSNVSYGFLSYSPSSIPYALYAAAGANSDITSLSGLAARGLRFASTNAIDLATAMPTTGSYVAGDIVLESTTGVRVSGWKRITTGSGHVLNTDWAYFNGGPVLGTVVATTSGAAIDFTGIPSWVKRITVMFSGVSTSGVSGILIRVGSGSIQTTGYLSTWVLTGPTTGNGIDSTGFCVLSTSVPETKIGHFVITHLGGNAWVGSGTYLVQASTGYMGTSAGNVTLSSVLDRVRLTTANGTDTFDAGSVNILYE